MFVLRVKHIKNLYLISNSVEPMPPLGTILGNLGVNTVKFCEEFNQKTKELPKYFALKTQIFIYENRTFKFKILEPTCCFFFNLLKFEKNLKIQKNDKWIEQKINCITLKDFIQVVLFKFPKKNLQKSINVLWGSLKSMNLIVVDS